MTVFGKPPQDVTVDDLIIEAMECGSNPSGHAYVYDNSETVGVIVLQGEWLRKVNEFITKEIGFDPNVRYNSEAKPLVEPAP